MTKPRGEGDAQSCLLRQGYDCLYPRVRRTVRTAAGMKQRIESLFPRYLFLQSDPTVQSLAPVRSTRSVSGIVRFGGEPAVVPDQVVQLIRQRMDEESGYVCLAPPDLVPGTRVRINEGPFSGLDAVFRAPSGEGRVRLLLQMLGSEREVVIPRYALGAHI